MARSYARISIDIWLDRDFRTLSMEAQWLYMVILSQANLSLAGVVAYTPGRWAAYATSLEPRDIDKALDELGAARYVLVDNSTAEVAVRTHLVHDVNLNNSNLARAAARDLAMVISEDLRTALVDGLPDGVRKALQAAMATDPGRHPTDRPDADQDGVRTPIRISASTSTTTTTSSNALSKKMSGNKQRDAAAGLEEGKEAGPTGGAAAEALKVLAQRDLAVARARGDVKNPGAYVNQCMARRRAVDGSTLTAVANEHPDWPAERVANFVDPQPQRLPEYEPEGTGNGHKPDMAAVRATAAKSRKRKPVAP